MARRPSAGGASGRRKKTAGRKCGAVGAAMMTVRHYCQGIGDCHLLRFRQRDGKTLHMLIDCGVHLNVSGGADMMRRIVADIAKTTKTIDVLVVTHEHWDHVSGFLAAAQEIKGLTIKDVWFSWAEDPKDPLARTLDTYKGKALSALQAADRHLAAAAPGGQPSALSQSLSGVLGFYFGAAGEKVRAARNAARDLATSKVVYHQPGTGPISLGEESGVSVYVLGPPQDAKAIGIEEIASELYGHGIAWGAVGERTAEQSIRSDENAPFDPEYGCPSTRCCRPLAHGSMDRWAGRRSASSCQSTTPSRLPPNPGGASIRTGWWAARSWR